MIYIANKFNVGETAYYAKGDTVKRVVVKRISVLITEDMHEIQYSDQNTIWYKQDQLQGSPEMAFYVQDNPVVDPVVDPEITMPLSSNREGRFGVRLRLDAEGEGV
jgi:hypothetical protein